MHLKRAVATEPSSEYVQALDEHLATMGARCEKLYRRARTPLARGQPFEAIRALQKAVLEFPGEAGFYNLLAIATFAAKKDRAKLLRSLRASIAT